MPHDLLRPIDIIEDFEPAFTPSRIAVLRRWGRDVYGAFIPTEQELAGADAAAAAGAPLPMGQDLRLFRIVDGDQHVGDITLGVGLGDEGQPEIDVSIFDGFAKLDGCTQHYASRAISAVVELTVPAEYPSLQAVVLGTNPNGQTMERVLTRCKFRRVGDRWLFP